MARKLQDFPNSRTPDSDYPYGGVKDDLGTENGTPVNEYTNGDIHQFFAKMLAEAGITANGLPDNNYSGFQFFEALGLIARYKTTSSTSNSIAIGSKTFEVGAGHAFAIGNRLRATDAANSANYMDGVVTAFTGGSVTILVDSIGGSGTNTSWNLNLGSVNNEGWKTVGAGGQPAFTNSWSAGGAPVQFRKEFNRVYLRGTITGGSLASSIFTLPEGYRPPYALRYLMMSDDSTDGVAILEVRTNGLVVPLLLVIGEGGNLTNYIAEFSWSVEA
jgi:hypothetical protein